MKRYVVVLARLMVALAVPAFATPRVKPNMAPSFQNFVRPSAWKGRPRKVGSRIPH